MATIPWTWWTFNWQSDTASVQNITEEEFNLVNNRLDWNIWSEGISSTLQNPINTTSNTQDFIPPVWTSGVDDALLQQQALDARIAEQNRQFVNTDLRNLTDQQIQEAQVWVDAQWRLLWAELDAQNAQNQIEVDTIEKLINENDRFTQETQKSASEANEITKQVLAQQQLQLAERNQALIRQQEIKGKVLQARATFESQMPWTGFSQASRAYLSNVIEVTTTQLAAFEAERNLEESDLAISSSRLINESNQQYQQVLNSNFWRMIELQGDYASALTQLKTWEITSKAKLEAGKSELRQQFLAQKVWLEKSFQNDLSQAQQNVLASYNNLRTVHEQRKQTQLQQYQIDVTSWAANKYTANQYSDLSKRTWIPIESLVQMRETSIKDSIASVIVESGIEGSPDQIQAIINQAYNYVKLGFPVSEAIARISWTLTGLSRDQTRIRNKEAARDSLEINLENRRRAAAIDLTSRQDAIATWVSEARAQLGVQLEWQRASLDIQLDWARREIEINWESAIANAKSQVRALSAAKIEAKNELMRNWQVEQITDSSWLPRKELVVTAREIWSFKDDLTHECAWYLQTYYGLNKYRSSSYSLSPFSNKQKIISDIWKSSTPQVWGIVAWNSWAKLKNGTDAWHIWRVVWVDWDTIMVENANLRWDRKVSVDTFSIKELKSKWIIFSKSIWTVDAVDSSQYNSIIGWEKKNKTLTAKQELDVENIEATRKNLISVASWNNIKPAEWKSWIYTDWWTSFYKPANGSAIPITSLSPEIVESLWKLLTKDPKVEKEDNEGSWNSFNSLFWVDPTNNSWAGSTNNTSI